MNTVDRLKTASNPQEGLQVLAQGIDALYIEIKKLQDEPPQADPWGDWGSVGVQAQTKAEELNDEAREIAEREIRILRGAISAENDPQERQMLEARLRLKLDDLKARPDYVDNEGDRVAFEIDDSKGDVVVELPVPDENTIKERGEFAVKKLKLDEEFGVGMDEAYSKGGPLWLYYGNREFVMTLSADTRREMVNDVARFSPAEAQEMGRDVLKDEGPGNSYEEFAERLPGD